MLDGILDEWLQQQRWHQCPSGVRLDVDVHLQAVAEPHLLDRQVLRHQIDLVLQRLQRALFPWAPQNKGN